MWRKAYCPLKAVDTILPDRMMKLCTSLFSFGFFRLCTVRTVSFFAGFANGISSLNIMVEP
jgi:hypothetical protein